MVKEILSQNGLIVLVDDDIYEKIKDFNWTVAAVNNRSRYRVSNREIGCLTKFIMGLNDDKLKVSFNDNNSLNLQRSNLSIASPSEISRKTKGHRNSSSQYKGVSWNKRLTKWHSRIRVLGKEIHLGFYESEDEAALAYNKAALIYFGENCYLNKIGEDNSADSIYVENDFQGRSKKPNGYRGICREGERWSARIGFKKESIYLGMYPTKEKAARAYDKKAYELYGDKAILNFPDEVQL